VIDCARHLAVKLMRLRAKVEIAQRLREQRRDAKNKLYALHAPEVACVAKGMFRAPNESGVKASVVVTAKDGLVGDIRWMPGNPQDGHTGDRQLDQIGILTGTAPKLALLNRGCRGVQASAGTRLRVSHRKRLPRHLKQLLKWRQVVEPKIGHKKTDGLLDRN
jgi:transposase, IS5 family